MAIKIDESKVSGVLVTCTACPSWHEFGWTRAEAWAAGGRHEQRVHPGQTQAQAALEQQLRRTRRAGSAQT